MLQRPFQASWHLRSNRSLSLRPLVLHQKTRTRDTLLDPCFKTGAPLRYINSRAGICVFLRARQEGKALLCTTLPSCPTHQKSADKVSIPLKSASNQVTPAYNSSMQIAPHQTYLSGAPLTQGKLSQKMELVFPSRLRLKRRVRALYAPPLSEMQHAPEYRRDAFLHSNFRHFSLFFQSSFHLSFAVLLCYWSLPHI